MNDLLFSLLLTAMWVAAWLHWCFRGKARHMLICYFLPKEWRLDTMDDEEFMVMSQDDFMVYLSASYEGHHLLRQWLGCPGCMSFALGILGGVFSLVTGTSFIALPILIPAGAWLGLLFHRKIL